MYYSDNMKESIRQRTVTGKMFGCNDVACLGNLVWWRPEKTALVFVDGKCAVGIEVNKTDWVNDIPEPRLRLTGSPRTFAL